ncbi:polysaccharide biosynthesis protein [Cryobacterium sp. TMS1-20-1]|uniref:polysaccharide biosynthesis protein n=1 Tax=Cryobacterium sp. TMS1-20-1 TaxID=1259223 RepID=UPI001068DB94|nr:nucleoside-diphosphate sugar epimerase/dehydratase [Cryobacterium sp. TMS1-20-1]TFC70137.1 polysaccharide biosynthesis protein [Cryobacterium sp. TMS1-20-1]
MSVTDVASTALRDLHKSIPLVRFGTQYAFDAASWAVALILAQAFRYEFLVDLIRWVPLLLLCLTAAILQLFIGSLYHLYRGRHPYGSFAEVRSLLWSVLVTALILGVPVIVFGTLVEIPRSTVIIALPMAFIYMGGVRYYKRLLVERAIVPADDASNTLVYGAGYLGSSIVRRMKTDAQSSFRAVGLIDDDPQRSNVWLHGVRVLGTGSDLTRVAKAAQATVLIVAIARVDAVRLREISDKADAAGLRVKVFPTLDEVLKGKVRLNDLRDLSIEDLIGRQPVDTEMASIAGYIAGKRVLVTGAGGSIGSELCRQINKFGPSELIMLDRDETGLQTTQISILGHGLLDTKDVVLADIRDLDALTEIFTERRPDVVFHAAALKHLSMLEQYPDEAWKTNVLGTRNVLQAAQEAGVKTFVNISTDKAANPTSVLGYSKRAGEQLTAYAAEQTGHDYISVRFGNVIGSRGSMLPTFTALIEAGGPLTITHPDVTRFFMTIPEACQLVVQAGGIGRPGEVLILDMGEPVRILDIAQRMIAQSGQNIEIVYTGLREGEKLHEELVGLGESDERPLHPKISHTHVAPIAPAHLDEQVWHRSYRHHAHAPLHRESVSHE